MGGSADEGGAWEYGRLEVLINGMWSVILFQDLGRRGEQVACRSLGFDAGAQLLVGQSSPFPGPPGSLRLTNDILCEGSETSLAECDITIRENDNGRVSLQSASALICSNPSGGICPAPCC